MAVPSSEISALLAGLRLVPISPASLPDAGHVKVCYESISTASMSYTASIRVTSVKGWT